jgi:putative FmdB family regulatory protein
MPFYTYRCVHCGHEESFLRSMSDRDRAIYHCDKSLVKAMALPMVRQVTAPAVRVVNPAVARRPGRGRLA